MAIVQKNRYENLNMDNLIVNNDNKSLINYLKDYKNNIEIKINNCENVIINGKVGTGKTYITKAFMNDLKNVIVDKQQKVWVSGKGLETQTTKSNISIRYIIMSDLLSELRKEYKNETVDRNLFTCDLLIIDEIGIQFGTDAERQILFKLINERYENYKPVIMISNHPLKSTNETKGLYFILGERIMDRMNNSSCKTFTMVGNSMR